jgi:glucose-6-phosphate isomerase
LDASQRIWTVGLRRAWTSSGAVARWVREKGISGAVWTPASYEISDVGAALVSLVEAGASPDAALLHDLASVDVRAAAEALAGAYRDSEGRTGYVAVFMDPSRDKDAARSARDLMRDIRRPNVAAALAWSASGSHAVEAMVAAGVPVALAGVRDKSARDAAAAARARGMDRLRADAAKLERPPESVPQVPVFLLGADEDEEDAGLFAVSLTTELALFSELAPSGAGVPLSAEAEQTGMRNAVDALAARAKLPARDDAYAPPGFAAAVRREAGDLVTDDVLADVWARDHTAWKDDPTEIADRLGWLDVPELMWRRLDDITDFARTARAKGEVQHVVLCGMGGSSLAPQTFHRVLGGGLPLTVCDTTDPDYISSLTASLDMDKTVFVVASKSGTTVETRSHLEHFWSKCPRGDRFVAITDPGTDLAKTAAERGFLRCFENPPDIGGRFSALSYFGLVPAALAGVDVRTILDAARTQMLRDGPGASPPDSPGVRLGTAFGEAKLKGSEDKLTFVLPRELEALGPWCEQLVAESTGKQGTGLLPVVGEDLGSPDVYGGDRLFVVYGLAGRPRPPELEAIETDHPVVVITVPDAGTVGAEMYRWEMAIAITGYLLDINPFDQPDVEAAKQRARDALSGSGAKPDAGSAAQLLSSVTPPQYIALQAFITPSDENQKRLQAVRSKLRERFHVAVTTGFGPRFLHSTGQFHKGGTNTGVFLQITGPHATDVDIPGMGMTFGKLIDAQADGDLQALRDAGRSAARVSIGELEQLAG